MEFKENYTILEYANIPSVNITRMEFKDVEGNINPKVYSCVNITRMEFKGRIDVLLLSSILCKYNQNGI